VTNKTGYDSENLDKVAGNIGKIMDDMRPFTDLKGHVLNAGSFELADWLERIVLDRCYAIMMHADHLRIMFEKMEPKLKEIAADFDELDSRNASKIKDMLGELQGEIEEKWDSRDGDWADQLEEMQEGGQGGEDEENPEDEESPDDEGDEEVETEDDEENEDYEGSSDHLDELSNGYSSDYGPPPYGDRYPYGGQGPYPGQFPLGHQPGYGVAPNTLAEGEFNRYPSLPASPVPYGYEWQRLQYPAVSLAEPQEASPRVDASAPEPGYYPPVPVELYRQVDPLEQWIVPDGEPARFLPEAQYIEPRHFRGFVVLPMEEAPTNINELDREMGNRFE
jgi:hypothetical protein